MSLAFAKASQATQTPSPCSLARSSSDTPLFVLIALLPPCLFIVFSSSCLLPMPCTYSIYSATVTILFTTIHRHLFVFPSLPGLPELPGPSRKLTHNPTSSTRLTSLTSLPARSSSTGIRSSSSLSCASLNHELIGTACCGWKMYDVGELSMMMVSFRSRPTWERSWKCCVSCGKWRENENTDLDIIPLVVIAAFAE